MRRARHIVDSECASPGIMPAMPGGQRDDTGTEVLGETFSLCKVRVGGIEQRVGARARIVVIAGGWRSPPASALPTRGPRYAS
jgi:hypothetical protein